MLSGGQMSDKKKATTESLRAHFMSTSAASPAETLMNERIQKQKSRLRAELAAANQLAQTKDGKNADGTAQERESEDEEHDLDHSHAHGVHKQRRLRALSTNFSSEHLPTYLQPGEELQSTAPESARQKMRRRMSHDAKPSQPREYVIDVEKTRAALLAQEDLNGDCQITIDDSGPKTMKLGSLPSEGRQKYDVRGHYALSILLQELALAQEYGRRRIVLEESRLNENPVDRLSRMIKTHFWDGLTRCIDAEGMEIICLDPKNREANHRPRIYVPYTDPEQQRYWTKVALDKPHIQLEVVTLPEVITPEYVRSINQASGILCLAMKPETSLSDHNHQSDAHQNFKYDDRHATGEATTLKGCPFVVPGGRFNEMYGWDSYFEVLGLLIDGKVSVCRSMVDNFVYQIQHYGKILNANRSYYLTRSQPPFLTDMALQTFARMTSKGRRPEHVTWLHTVMHAALKEYFGVWMAEPRFVPEVGLSRYRAEGIGMPPETESSHFDAILQPYAEKYGLSIESFARGYNAGDIKEPALDAYFVHDRTVRESGHDTTYRFEGRCAWLCTVDLNSLLYKYEMDIASFIRDYANDRFLDSAGGAHTSGDFLARAAKRKALMDQYLWNEEKGMYFDYDIETKEKIDYESVTTLWPLWAGAASPEQATRVKQNLPKWEAFGGLTSGTESSRGTITLSRPNRQWDYPFGWAPHQILAWKALADYGFYEDAHRIAYKWLYTITVFMKSFVDFNGTVPEKFDVVTGNHRVNVEYGNVGVDFKFIPREGFGWMNSSFKVGLTYCDSKMKRALGALVPPAQLWRSPSPV